MSDAMDGLREMVEANDIRYEADAKRWAKIDRDLCMLCGAHGADKRSLFVNCMYAVYEVVPEAIDLHNVSVSQGGFYLLICKNCRADFLNMLGEWRDRRVARRGTPMDHDGSDMIDSDGLVAVRRHGETIWITKEQWQAEQEAQSVSH